MTPPFKVKADRLRTVFFPLITTILLSVAISASKTAYAGNQPSKKKTIDKNQMASLRLNILLSHFPDSINLTELKALYPLRRYAKQKNTHLVKRDNWARDIGYGDEKLFDAMFSQTVDIGLHGLRKQGWNFQQLMAFLEFMRFDIELKRGDKMFHGFGLRRDHFLCFENDISPFRKNTVTNVEEFNNLDIYPHYSTIMNDDYKYAIPRVLLLRKSRNDYTPGSQVLLLEDALRTRPFLGTYYYPQVKIDFHTTSGMIDGNEIPLTETAYIPRIRTGGAEQFTGHEDNFITDPYTGDIVTLRWLHTNPAYIKPALQHINKLFNEALATEDFRILIERLASIHWWMVQTTPYWRGPGTIAEMLVNICARYHNLVFPEWEPKVAPSIEVLVTDSEEEFISYYTELLGEFKEIQTEGFTMKMQSSQALQPSLLSWVIGLVRSWLYGKPTETNEEYQLALEKFLERNGWVLKDTPKDGDCFLHALSAQTGLDKEEIRKRLMSRIKGLIKSKINNEETEFELDLVELYSLLEELETHTWISGTMAQIAALEFQQPITIVHPNFQSGSHLETGTINPENLPIANPLTLIYTDGNHWTWADSYENIAIAESDVTIEIEANGTVHTTPPPPLIPGLDLNVIIDLSPATH